MRGAVAVSESAIPIPRQAIAVMFGTNDRAEGYAIQPDGSFYVDGAFDVRLPPGTYTLAISKGFEYLRETQAIELKAGSSVKREYKMRRWVDMPARGWYSADDHIHLRRSPADNHAIAQWIAAEVVHVAAGSTLRISAEAYGNSGQSPLRSVEIVGHGKVLARSEGKDAAHLTVDLELPVDHGIWIAAKCEAGQGQVAHTTPVYVTVNGGGWDNPRTLRRNLEVAEGYLKEVEQDLANPGNNPDRQAVRHRAQLERQIAEARSELRRMAGR